MANRLLGSFKIWPDDVFICSYPRSGNTWLRYLLAFYREPSVDWNIETIERIVPDLHRLRDWLLRPGKFLFDIPRPRIIKSHLLYNSRYPKVVYLVRDGRDVCVSYYLWNAQVRGYSRSFYHFVKDLCSEKIWPSSWHKHVESWLNNSDKVSVHIVRYEDLLANPEDALLSMVRFIGLEVSTSRAATAVRKASVQKVWSERPVTQRKSSFQPGISGKAGKWRNYFSKETEVLFIKFANRAMKICGYL